MFLKELLVACLLITLVSANVPSYIKVCGRRNPNLSKCILDSVMALKEKLKQGIPELEVPPIDPFQIDELKIADMPNFKGTAKNVTLSGLSNFEIEFMDFDLKTMTLKIGATFRDIHLTGFYDISAKILVPIVGTGPLTIKCNALKSMATIQLKFAERGGKKYVYFASMTENLMVQDYNAEMGLDSGNIALQEAINQVLGNSHEEVIEATRPTLEHHIAERTLSMSNNICKHFTFDELFPDRE